MLFSKCYLKKTLDHVKITFKLTGCTMFLLFTVLVDMRLERSGVRWPWDYCIICLHLSAAIKKRSAQVSINYRVINPFQVKAFFMCPSLFPCSFLSIWFKLQIKVCDREQLLSSLKQCSNKGNSGHEPSKAVYHYSFIHFIVF